MIGLNDELSAAPASRLPEQVVEVFAAGGWLESRLELEHRPAQEQMARAVAAALGEDSPLLFEAGTGVGKSVAYLVPGLIHAVDAKRPMIVSTHTISLQEQIETQDLPLCRRLFAAEPALERYAGFKSALLVGKSNYLCTTRLARAREDRASLFAEDDYAELQRIAAWSDTTATGLRHELSPAPRPEVWEAVSADSSACARKYCDCERCFYQRARARLRSAQVIIVNHALLFALIRAGGARAEGATGELHGVLFPDDFVVLDEAHTVPEVATAHFGLSLSSHGLERALKHLYNPRTKRGLLVKFRGAQAKPFVEAALGAATRFFARVDATLLAARPIVRLREALPPHPELESALAGLQRLVAGMADQLDDGRERDELLEEKDRLQSYQASIGEWLGLADAGHVYWAERGGRQQTIIILRSAPIHVAPALRRQLFGCGTSVITTSATLALAGEIAPFAARIGAEGARSAIAPSPFDFARQMRVYVAADMPLPSPDQARLALDALADYIAFCTLRVRGGSLVLFTSHSDLRSVAAAPRAPLSGSRPAAPAPGGDGFLGRARPADALAGERRALRHRQLLDGRRCPGRRARPGRHHPPALRSADPPRHRGAGGADSRRGRQSLQRPHPAGRPDQVPAGDRPADPEADGPGADHDPRRPDPRQGVRPDLPRVPPPAGIHPPDAGEPRG